MSKTVDGKGEGKSDQEFLPLIPLFGVKSEVVPVDSGEITLIYQLVGYVNATEAQHKRPFSVT